MHVITKKYNSKLHKGSVSKNQTRRLADPKAKFGCWQLTGVVCEAHGSRTGIRPTHFQTWMESRRSYCMANISHTLTHFGSSKPGEASVPY